MSPIDYRNTTWSDVQDRLHGDLMHVLEALGAFGPVTTQELADLCAKHRLPVQSVLTIRPRVHDLVTLGFAELVDAKKEAAVVEAARMRGYSRGGVYRRLDPAKAYALYLRRVRAANRETQPDMFQ